MKTNYFYFLLPLTTLEKIITDHQEQFDILLKDLFSDDELLKFEKMIDTIAAITVQPIISELTFDDFYVNQSLAFRQRNFFESCQSSVCLENIPYLQSNPFQISYLLMLVDRFEQILIDRGGVNELQFKDEYVNELKKYKNMESLVTVQKDKPFELTTTKPVDPIDFIILDVYKEIERLKSEGKIEELDFPSPKRLKIFVVMSEQPGLNAQELLVKSGLIAKDFGDSLEGLKFYLKKE